MGLGPCVCATVVVSDMGYGSETLCVCLLSAENDTAAPKAKPGKKKAAKEKDVTPKGRTVKVNLTAEVTTLDLPPSSAPSTQASADK